CTRFTDVLHRLYPQVFFYDSTGPVWDPGRPQGVFWTWSEPVKFDQVHLSNQALVFQGMAFWKWNVRPPDVDLELVYPKEMKMPEDGADYPLPEVIYKVLGKK